MEFKDKTKEDLIKELSAMSQRIVELEKSETKIRKAEEDLRKEREFTEKTINALRDTFFVFNPNTEKAILWNRQFQEVSGYTDEEIASLKAPSSYYSPEDLEKAAAAIEEVMCKGQVKVEMSLICKNGTHIPTEYLASTINDEENKPKHIIAIGRDITQRKMTENALLESEKRLRQAQQIGKLGFLDWDLVTNKIEWSEETFQIYGFDPNNFEPTIETTVDLVHPDDKRLVEKSLKAAIDDKTIYDIEHRLVLTDGKVIYVDVNAEVTRDENESPVRMLGTIKDITERKRIENALKDQETKLNNLLTNVDAIVLEGDPFNIYYVGGQVEKLLGYPREKWFEDPDGPAGFWFKLLHTDDKLKAENCAEAIRKGRNHSFEYRLKTADGNYRWFYDSITVETENSLPVKARSIMVDITEHKQANENLSKSEHELSSIYNAITDYLTVISTDYRIARVNSTVENYYGIDLVGKVCYEVYQGRKEICPNCPTRKAIETKKPAFSFQPATEMSPPVDIYAFPILNVEGEVVAVVEHGKDITKRKQAEEERENLNAELARKNNELEQIVYVTSHDLRTPLVNIDGYSKRIGILIKKLGIILESAVISQEVKENIDLLIRKEIPLAEHYIATSVSKMDALLSGLLQISRLGQLKIIKEKLDMNSIVSETLDTTKYLVEKSGAKLKIAELPSCTGDKNQMSQLFSNLIDNALKYLDSNRNGIIKVSGKKEGAYSVYCVEDNGIGISPDHQEKIFEIFYQLKPKKSTGEGLGLTIVKKIVDIHHGKVWLESQVGTGSKFYVSLPKA